MLTNLYLPALSNCPAYDRHPQCHQQTGRSSPCGDRWTLPRFYKLHL